MSAEQQIPAEDFHAALVEADVLEVFSQLPMADQDRFTAWIDQAREPESHWRRINALVLALRSSPLKTEDLPEAADHSGTQG